jgi:hypothetical protein
MSSLTILKDKDPKEVARLLSVVSTSVLPNPEIGDAILQSEADPKLVREVLNQVRDYLRVKENDYSAKTQSRIYAFLSEEISSVALAGTDLNRIQTRLGNKGELHPSQYQVEFDDGGMDEGLGNKRSHVAEAITHPNKVAHLRAKYLPEEHDPRITISLKHVSTQKGGFLLLIFSSRRGRVQMVFNSYRIYPSDVNLNNTSEPLDVAKAFIDTYGMTFSFGDKVSKILRNELVRFDDPASRGRLDYIKLLDGNKGDYYYRFLVGADSQLYGTSGENMGEVVFGYVLNISKYVATLRKYNVALLPEAKWVLPRI